jgi:hypothetical protein
VITNVGRRATTHIRFGPLASQYSKQSAVR